MTALVLSSAKLLIELNTKSLTEKIKFTEKISPEKRTKELNISKRPPTEMFFSFKEEFFISLF